MKDTVAFLPQSKTALTRRQTRLAEYILENQDDAVFMTVAQLAEASGVSDATVVRLAQALGFDGFPEMKQHLRAALVTRLDTVSRLKRTASQIDNVNQLIASVVQQDSKNLLETAEHLDIDRIVGIAHVLKDTEDINIIGLRSAHSLAVLLSSTLGFLGKRVRLIVPGTGEIWREVSTISRNSVLIAISFPRYTRLTVEVAESVHRSGITVVSLTDSPFSPLAPCSDHLLTVQCHIDSFIESYVTILSLINALVTAIAFLGGEKAVRQLKRMEQMWDEKNIYHKPEKRDMPSWAIHSRPEQEKTSGKNCSS
ncbi:MAG: MurR/RpiR family transcriptional regulator [Desulfatirhabdiaceae bacterium]